MGFYTKQISEDTFNIKYELKSLAIALDSVYKSLIVVTGQLDTLIALESARAGCRQQQEQQ